MEMNQKRQFSNEFKTEAVRRVREEGRAPASVARELEIPRQVLADWLKRAAQLSRKPESEPLSTDEREELRRLRRENERLKMEREILKKAAAFFAKESE